MNNKSQNVQRIFSGCLSMSSIPDLSKWKFILNYDDFNTIFDRCISSINMSENSKEKNK